MLVAKFFVAVDSGNNMCRIGYSAVYRYSIMSQAETKM